MVHTTKNPGADVTTYYHSSSAAKKTSSDNAYRDWLNDIRVGFYEAADYGTDWAGAGSGVNVTTTFPAIPSSGVSFLRVNTNGGSDVIRYYFYNGAVPAWEFLDQYSHPTTNGNIHLPLTGTTTQLLQWSSTGTAKWITMSSDASIADNGAITVAASHAGSAHHAAITTLAASAITSGIFPATAFTFSSTFNLTGIGVTAGTGFLARHTTGGVITYRTNTQTLGDIGAAASSHGSHHTYARALVNATNTQGFGGPNNGTKPIALAPAASSPYYQRKTGTQSFTIQNNGGAAYNFTFQYSLNNGVGYTTINSTSIANGASATFTDTSTRLCSVEGGEIYYRISVTSTSWIETSRPANATIQRAYQLETW